MPTSPKWETPYPALTDSASMDDQISAMAFSLDNIAKDVPQGTLANRPVSTVGTPGKVGRYYYATDYAVLFRDFGTGWRLASSVEFGTTLPSNPEDDMLYDYLASDALGIVWRLKYNSLQPTYKWEFQGNGPSLFAETTGTSGLDQYAYSSMSGPAIAIPLAGEYDLEFGGHLSINRAGGGVAAMSPRLSIWLNASDDDAVYHDQQVFYNPGPFHIQGRMEAFGSRLKRVIVPAPYTVEIKYRLFAGLGPALFSERWLKATPVRVG